MSRVAGKSSAFVLLGPTASGKSRLAMQLASKHPIEIVSIDSAQVYRGMDIGTAKPSAAERRAVPHHLIDLLDPTEAYSAGRFREDACAHGPGNSRKKENSAARRRHDALLPGAVAGHRCPAAGRTRAARADRCARRAPRLAGAARRPGAGGSRHRRAPRPQRRAAHPARARSLGTRRASRFPSCSSPPKRGIAVRAESLRPRPGRARRAAPAHRGALRRHAEGGTGRRTARPAAANTSCMPGFPACARRLPAGLAIPRRRDHGERNCAKPASPRRASSPSASSPGCAACPASSRRSGSPRPQRA